MQLKNPWDSSEVLSLTKNGIWLSDGEEITHEPTRRLFARSLKKDEHGYFIQVGREWKRVAVEDTAYFVTRISGSYEKGFELHLSDETHEPLKPETLEYKPGRLVCRIANGEEARFLRAPYFELLHDLEEDQKSYFLVLRGQRVDLLLKGDH